MRWIKISDKMPVEDQEILMFDKTYDINLGFFSKGIFFVYTYGGKDIVLEQVTHWCVVTRPKI